MQPLKCWENISMKCGTLAAGSVFHKMDLVGDAKDKPIQIGHRGILNENQARWTVKLRCELSEMINYSVLILDRFTWNLHVERIKSKAKIALIRLEALLAKNMGSDTKHFVMAVHNGG